MFLLRRRLVDAASYIVGAILILTLLVVIELFSPDIFGVAFGPSATPDFVLDYEAVMIWRERGLDTLLQVLALSASLLGVLLFMIRGGMRHD